MKSLILICLLIFIGCKPINQKINKKREGLWIEYYTQDSLNYKSKGSYNKGDQIKKWKYYLDNKIIMREKYRGNHCSVTRYFKNGRIESKGETKLDTSQKYLHWYYTGDWAFFDEKGNPTQIKKYDHGKLISEITLTANN